MSENSVSPTNAIPRPTLERLPRYLVYLKARRDEGCLQTSSTIIAQDLRLNAVQVRKDLAFVSSGGKPRTGHNTQELIERLEEFLCTPTAKDAVLVGVGRLGQALLSYQGFADYGLDILAAFDCDEGIIGTEFHGRCIFSVSKLSNLTCRLGVLIGIIAVPASAAQTVCDMLVAGGVRGIMNFAPAHLDVPESVIVYNEDLAATLALLAGEVAGTLNGARGGMLSEGEQVSSS